MTNLLIFYPVGALADRYGRRWPLMIDIILFSIINMASGFAPNLQTFIGLRAVFGICMVKSPFVCVCVCVIKLSRHLCVTYFCLFSFL